MDVKAEEKVKSPRSYSVEFKEAAVARMASGESPAALARELGIFPKLLYYWRQQLKQGRKMNQRGRVKQPVPRRDPVQELRQLVGKQQLELSFFRGALRRVEAMTPGSNDTGVTPSLPKSGK